MRPDRLVRLHRAVDRQMGEAIVLVPFASGGYLVGRPDESRPVMEIVAVVTDVPTISRALGAGAKTGHNAELRTATHTATFTASAVPYALDRGDRLVLLERDCAELQIDAEMPHGTDRTILKMKPLPPGSGMV